MDFGFSPQEEAFRKARTKAETLEKAMAFYFGQVVVANIPDAEWIVEEFAFERGRYEIGVRSGSMTFTLRSFGDKVNHTKNQNRDSIWRTYQHYFARNPQVTVDF